MLKPRRSCRSFERYCIYDRYMSVSSSRLSVKDQWLRLRQRGENRIEGEVLNEFRTILDYKKIQEGSTLHHVKQLDTRPKKFNCNQLLSKQDLHLLLPPTKKIRLRSKSKVLGGRQKGPRLKVIFLQKTLFNSESRKEFTCSVTKRDVQDWRVLYMQDKKYYHLIV